MQKIPYHKTNKNYDVTIFIVKASSYWEPEWKIVGHFFNNIEAYNFLIEKRKKNAEFCIGVSDGDVDYTLSEGHISNIKPTVF